MATMNVSLPDAMKAWVESRTADGRYANASDYVRDLIRRDQERQAALESLMVEAQKGIDSGVAEDFDPEVFRARMRAMTHRG
ncbi:type II toxin-antitoxin system ParD family antitoxin [Roseicyclus persicicus]|uniref:Type II toxin-antitoxin system ParD family antitoxin n=1 Tax=Roseicyclus persicicus TaxID=2650661 RepID=A0A7X6GZT1_9RHOB|nr:type II toxin-antitoxin system ParD family antitoxin [Roseibacterium persicicum]NKX44137.1 type II toxin-antitoxin system ParD family antitoxin [Roseibacterium persicicum]